MIAMASQTMLAGMKFSITGTPNSHGAFIKPLMQDSLDQCPVSMNADQNSGIDPNVNQFRSMPIKIMALIRNASQRIDRH